MPRTSHSLDSRDPRFPSGLIYVTHVCLHHKDLSRNRYEIWISFLFRDKRDARESRSRRVSILIKITAGGLISLPRRNARVTYDRPVGKAQRTSRRTANEIGSGNCAVAYRCSVARHYRSHIVKHLSLIGLFERARDDGGFSSAT